MIIEDPSHTVPSPTRYCNELHRYATWRKMALLQRPRDRGLPQCHARPRSQTISFLMGHFVARYVSSLTLPIPLPRSVALCLLILFTGLLTNFAHCLVGQLYSLVCVIPVNALNGNTRFLFSLERHPSSITVR